MRFIRSRADVPLSAAVVFEGPAMEVVLTGIRPGDPAPVPGGAGAEMTEIFRQLDLILDAEGLDWRAVCSARLYVGEIGRDMPAINAAWKTYMRGHPANRRAYGVALQRGMLVEAAFVVEMGAAAT